MEEAMTNEEKIKAEVLDRLITHLQTSTELQNIDLMDLAGFCRNCLARWYICLLYTSPSPRDRQKSRMPSSA